MVLHVSQQRGETVTVGVALPVPEPWGSQVWRARLGYGESSAENIPTHVTLMPPTVTTGAQVEALLPHLEQVAAEHAAFPMVLRGTGTFRPVSDVVYLQVARGVSSCELLERAVRSGPVHRELDFTYHPHVTVAHNLPQDVLDRAFEELAEFTAEFSADRLVAYAHHGDEVWAPLASYELRGQATAALSRPIARA